MTVFASLVLIAGIGAFAWSLLEQQPPPKAGPARASQSQSSSPANRGPAATADSRDRSQPQSAKPAQPSPAKPEAPRSDLPEDMINLLIQRGNAMLASGDIAAARLLFQRAAEAGNAGAATSLARTYDPTYLARNGAIGIQANASLAADWYRRADALRAPSGQTASTPTPTTAPAPVPPQNPTPKDAKSR